jgi:hypothetical protein
MPKADGKKEGGIAIPLKPKQMLASVEVSDAYARASR